MRVDEVESWRRAPVADQAWLDVLRVERAPQQWVAEQVDLADRQVIRCSPPSVDEPRLVGMEWTGRRARDGHGLGHVGPPLAAQGSVPRPTTGCARPHGTAIG